jgi:GT2 family glycosyltransferase
VKVSIILACYNGAATLPRTLAALAKLEHPDFALELLLVDNASNDATPVLMQEFAAKYPARYVSEPKPGRSNALNTGIQLATGELLVFTDDDVIPDPQWVAAFVDAYRRRPDVAAFAGQIRLDWPKKPTRWLATLEQMGRTLGATPADRTECFIPASDVKGANAAIRSEALSLVGGFRTDLGVSKEGPLIAGEETAFFGQLEAVGFPTLFVPNAKLLHIVRPVQMSLRALMQRGFRNGRGVAKIEREPLPSSRFSFRGLPAYAIINVLKIVISATRKGLRGDSVGAACDMLHAAEMWGFFWGKTSSHQS